MSSTDHPDAPLEEKLGRQFGLDQFGVNRVTLAPGQRSARRHWHEGEDEFVYVLSGAPTLIDDNGSRVLTAGSCVGFRRAAPNAHHLVNRTGNVAILLVVGTRRRGEEVIHYPDEAVTRATVRRDENGERIIGEG